jgi:hypothetical protein
MGAETEREVEVTDKMAHAGSRILEDMFECLPITGRNTAILLFQEMWSARDVAQTCATKC